MANPTLYPLKFEPIYKEKIWGGNKIRTHLNKDYGTLSNCGESWEISGVKGDLSVVASGELKGKSLPDVIDTYGADLVGDSVHKKFGNEFPLLVKFIDANDDLSIQVHPSDEIAKERHNSFGKTEMWYIIQSDPGATLYNGFSEPVTKDQLRQYSTSDEILKILNKESVKSGDVYFLPSGQVHSIGKGILLAEIQQTSDITYRVYDFDRVDNLGKKRDLHIDEALDVIDFEIKSSYKTPINPQLNETTKVVDCDYFTTNLLIIDSPISKNFEAIDSFKIYLGLEGKAELKCGDHSITVTAGESVLIPACFTDITFLPAGNTKLLESYVS